MTTKALLWLFSIWSVNRNREPHEKVDTLDVVRDVIRSEISSIGLQIAAGIILVGAIVFSVVELGILLRNYLGNFENGATLQALSFGFITIAAVGLLFMVFNRKSSARKVKQEAKEMGFEDIPAMVPHIAAKFLQGFLEGLDTPRQRRTADNVMGDDEFYAHPSASN